MHLPLLQDFLILLGFSVVVVLVLQRLKLPSILGFILTGILIGPYGLGLVHESEEIEIISEIGVILLLFVIGMELSIKHLLSIRNTVFIGGALQVGLTVLVSGLIYYLLGKEWNEALFVGFLFQYRHRLKGIAGQKRNISSSWTQCPCHPYFPGYYCSTDDAVHPHHCRADG